MRQFIRKLCNNFISIEICDLQTANGVKKVTGFFCDFLGGGGVEPHVIFN